MMEQITQEQMKARLETMVAANELWSHTFENANRDRAELLMTKLAEYLNLLFVGESNADVMITLISSLASFGWELAERSDVPPEVMICTLQLGLQHGLLSFSEATERE